MFGSAVEVAHAPGKGARRRLERARPPPSFPSERADPIQRSYGEKPCYKPKHGLATLLTHLEGMRRQLPIVFLTFCATDSLSNLELTLPT